MKKIINDLPMMAILIHGLVLVVFLIFTFIFSVENDSNARDEKSSVPMANSSSFGTIEKDETTGCEYIIFRNIVIPRIDETGTKVRGCKESQ